MVSKAQQSAKVKTESQSSSGAKKPTFKFGSHKQKANGFKSVHHASPTWRKQKGYLRLVKCKFQKHADPALINTETGNMQLRALPPDGNNHVCCSRPHTAANCRAAARECH